MNIKITSRHFKAHDSLIRYANQSIEELTNLYDGIIKAEIIFSYEKPRNSQKNTEIILSVYGKTLRVTANSEEFEKSVDLAIDKLKTRLRKYKDKLHSRDRKKVRKIKLKP